MAVDSALPSTLLLPLVSPYTFIPLLTMRPNEARTQEALLRYQQAIQQAFGEVADSLVGVRQRKEVREQNEAAVAAQRDALRLATMRYEGGVTSFLEVLVTERDLFDAELLLAQTWRDEILAIVQLYKALGGSWQTEHAPLAGEEVGDPAARAGAAPCGVCLRP